MRKFFVPKIVLTCFSLYFLFVFTNIFSAEASDDHCIIFNAEDGSYFQLAKALQDSGDWSSSFRTYNFIIEQRESRQINDKLYHEALHETRSIYPIEKSDKLSQVIEKNQMQDQPALTSKIENGYIIIENFPSDSLNEKNCDWVQEVLTIFGMEVAPSDIHFEKNSLRVKLPSCCCPCRTQPFDAENEQQ